ncbi:hypothetical protein COO91_08110 [Nostoc flagelliforme CCNUN1]|uniref:Uncharacterized protein n=1 Tax=Nostoc flagelliforme CCNUN1 TaxID=2038116 RepID=A0A2K8T2T3_9NOSO|nr:hypothetical protein COO91_08110 [Nostoc flagelliforme CCNUN1]
MHSFPDHCDRLLIYMNNVVLAQRSLSYWRSLIFITPSR